MSCASAIISFATNATVDFDLDDYSRDTMAMQQHVESLDFRNDQTNISGAFRLLRREVGQGTGQKMEQKRVGKC